MRVRSGSNQGKLTTKKNTGMDTTAATMHPAEEYLRNEQNPPVLYVRIYGERRKLFINRGRENVVGIIAKGKRSMFLKRLRMGW